MTEENEHLAALAKLREKLVEQRRIMMSVDDVDEQREALAECQATIRDVDDAIADERRLALKFSTTTTL